MVDFSEIAKLALSHSHSICQEIFPMGKRRGSEFVIGDIYGNIGDSLSINLNTGIWTDFAGKSKGGDLTSLVAAAKTISQTEAAEWIASRYSGPPKEPVKNEFSPIFPVTDPSDKDFLHPAHGEPDHIYAYYDRVGALLNFVCRFENGDKKTFLPLSYGSLSGKIKWHWKQHPAPRMLYHLDTLPESGEIVIVEGEKAAEAFSEKFPDKCVITWPGGAQAVKSADWSPLFNKNYAILLWPDNDDPGKEAMFQVACILRGKVATIDILDVSGLPPKADMADWDKSDYELRNFLIEKRKLFKFPEPELKQIEADPRFGFDPMTLEGLIGDTVRWICRHAIFPQPELALLNVLAFAGSVFGRRWIGPTGVHTNIYTVGIASTGSGKDHSRKMLTYLAAHSGLSAFLGGNAIRSDTGMLRGLEKHSCQLLMLDEFGMWLDGVSNPRAPHHIQSVIQTFLTLYSSSGSVYDHGTYANEATNKKIIIHNPVLCIYGTTTESRYIPTLSKSAVESGQMGRFIAIPGRTNVIPNHDAPIVGDDDADIIAKWKEFAPTENLGAIVNSATIAPKPKLINIGQCEDIKRELLEKQTREAQSGKPTAELWVRYWENILKLAAIFAVARDRNDPVHKKEDFEIASTIVEHSLHYIESLVQNHMAETPHEALVHEFMNFLRKKPGGVTLSELTRRFQKIEKKKREEVIAGLLDQEAIVAEQVDIEREGRGKIKKTTYRIL